MGLLGHLSISHQVRSAAQCGDFYEPVVVLRGWISWPSNLPLVRELTDRLFIARPDENEETSRIRGILTVIRDRDTADIRFTMRGGRAPQFSWGMIWRPRVIAQASNSGQLF
jgi:hypothetical protein